MMLEDLSYINCRDLLESTGIHNISESGGEISFSCPGPDHFHGDTSPSARMNSRTSAWICHGCGHRGNAITFLAWHKSLPETVARRLLEVRYGGGSISLGVENLEDMVNKVMNPEIIKEEIRISPDESWLDKFYVEWKHERPWISLACQYMLNRGFSAKILEQYQVGYDEISDRITIPIRDQGGRLVGFKGRAWRENTIPKYMILGDNRNQNRYGFQPYQKSRYVFGLNRFIKRCLAGAIIVEGELNVIAMDQHGYDNCIGIAGSEFSEKQCDIIKSNCKYVTVFLDNDKAGNKGTKKVVEMLSPYMEVRIVQNAPGDAADSDTDSVRDLISSAKSSLELQVEGKL